MIYGSGKQVIAYGCCVCTGYGAENINLNFNYFRQGGYSEAIEGIFGLCLEFKNRKFPAEKYKKNSQPGFAGWPLRRRTDEEIIRLCDL